MDIDVVITIKRHVKRSMSQKLGDLRRLVTIQILENLGFDRAEGLLYFSLTCISITTGDPRNLSKDVLAVVVLVWGLIIYGW